MNKTLEEENVGSARCDTRCDTISRDARNRIREAESRIAAEEELQRLQKVKTRKRISAVLVILVILFATSCFYDLHAMRELNKPIEIAHEKQIENINVHFYLVTLKLEAYREVHGRFPNSLADEIEDEGVQYTLHEDGTYTLGYDLDGTVLTYHSLDDPEDLLSSEFIEKVLGGNDNNG